ncbi:MAG TPA: transglycosylase SLT domain-containing protein [bacterium]|nr:transglycosylase SLT domain-containing protein [bacterium]
MAIINAIMPPFDMPPSPTPTPGPSRLWKGARSLAVRAAIIAILALSLLARGQDAPVAPAPVDPGQALARAADLAREGSCAAAIGSAAVALKNAADPAMQGRAQLLVGYCSYKLKKYDDARQSLREASRLYPELSFHGLYYGALSFQDQENYPEAVSLWEKLLAGNPPGDLSGRALMQLMRCHRKSDNADAAAAAIARIKALPPAARDQAWDRELDFTRGWVKLKKAEKAEARKIFKDLWVGHPECFWAGQAEKYLIGDEAKPLLLPGETAAVTQNDRIERIKNLVEQNQPSDALAELKPIIASAEKKPRAEHLIPLYRLRATAYDNKRELTKAVADYQKVQDLAGQEDVEITYLIAACYRRMGKHQDALEKYRRVWTRYPRSVYATRALFYAARMMKMDNDFKGAEDAYRRLIEVYPHSSHRPEALFQLAWLRYLNKDYQKAREYLAAAPKKTGDDEFNARLLYWKADVLHKLGDHKAAAALEQQILRDYWDTSYAFCLVMVGGLKWPYPPGGRPLPPPAAAPPLEYRIARELYALGLEDDADGQLQSLAASGRLPEELAFPVAAMRLQTGNYNGAQRIAARSLKSRLATPPPGEAEAWRLAYPQAFPEHVTKYAAAYSLDPLLVYAVMRAESTYRPDIRSSAGAIGLMQVMPGTGRVIAKGLGEKNFTTASLNQPEQSVKYGCYYLAAKLTRFSDGGASPESKLKTLAAALAAYNAGPERADRWGQRADQLGLSPAAFIEEIPIKETNDYVKRILGYYLIYLTAYQPPPAPEAHKTTETSD